MTIEEAAEVILAGSPFTTCVSCLGGGWRKKQRVETGPPYLLETVPVLCTDCDMTGKVLRPQYAEACMLLRLELPKAKLTQEATFGIASGRMRVPATKASAVMSGAIMDAYVNGWAASLPEYKASKKR